MVSRVSLVRTCFFYLTKCDIKEDMILITSVRFFFSGEKFDIKDYHHVFLSAGPMGIDTLEEAVDEYIANSLTP